MLKGQFEILPRSLLEKALLTEVNARPANLNEFPAPSAACLNYSLTIFNNPAAQSPSLW